MYGETQHIPRQRIPRSKKNQKWREDCVEAYINLSKFGVSERRSYLKSLYDYYNGVIDEPQALRQDKTELPLQAP